MFWVHLPVFPLSTTTNWCLGFHESATTASVKAVRQDQIEITLPESLEVRTTSEWEHEKRKDKNAISRDRVFGKRRTTQLAPGRFQGVLCAFQIFFKEAYSLNIKLRSVNSFWLTISSCRCSCFWSKARIGLEDIHEITLGAAKGSRLRKWRGPQMKFQRRC